MSLTVHVFADHPSRYEVAQVRGELDLGTVDELERSIRNIDSASGGVVIDLSATEFMDSSGLRLLTATQERLAAQGRRLKIVVVEGAVKRVLEVTDLLDDFDVYATLEEALR